jgi:DNA-binding NarL/FixJ family response regulator
MSSSRNPIRILAVDDHATFRRGIAGFLADEEDMQLVAEAAGGHEAIKQFRIHHPDVTLMDLDMPEMNGLDSLIAIRGEFPEAKIIVLTISSGDVQVLRALKAGACAYLLKNLLHKELLETIRAVHAGKKALSPEVSYQLAEHATDDALTPAEIAVLRLIAAGKANKQIADQLSMSEETVKGRVRSILSKLNANDRTHAAAADGFCARCAGNPLRKDRPAVNWNGPSATPFTSRHVFTGGPCCACNEPSAPSCC